MYEHENKEEDNENKKEIKENNNEKFANGIKETSECINYEDIRKKAKTISNKVNSIDINKNDLECFLFKIDV